MAVMNDLRADGRSLIFISHKLDEALGIADDITVLRDGEAIGTVRAEDTDEQELARMMVGREVLFDRLSREAEPGDPALEVEELWMSGDRGRDQVQGVDLTVREGEILGIAGVQGNGQSELVEGITGLRSVDDGSIRLGNEEITDRSRRARIESGIAYIPEDRQTEGLVQEYSLVRNALLGNQTVEPYATGGRIDWSAVKDHAEEIIEEFDVQPPTVENDAESLRRQPTEVHRRPRDRTRPDVMIAAHPTRGVDIGSIEFIHNRLIELREEGSRSSSSSKLEEIQKLSDRIAVMYEGEFVDVVDPERVTEEELGLLMTGGSLEDDVTEETETDTEAQA